MVGSGLKKLASEYGMHIDKGIAYGDLGGYAATMSEGSGYKRIVFTVRFTDLANRSRLSDLLNATDLKKEFRIINTSIDSQTIHFVFHDTMGTMKRIRAFLDWFLPVLKEYGATGVNTCSECAMELTSGKWIMVNGVAFYVHDACAERVRNSIDSENTRKKEEDTGSYLTGAVGAIVGASIGAVVWALVLLLGYLASVVGLLIGWLAEKGYTLLHGKNGRAKVLILVVAVVFGVIAGTVAADAMSLGQMINAGELPGWELSDIPEMLMILAEDPEYLEATGQNILLGLLFAALGVFALLRKTGKEVSGVKYVELN